MSYTEFKKYLLLTIYTGLSLISHVGWAYPNDSKERRENIHPEVVKPIIKGTFIQEFLVKNWDDQRWQEEFLTLKSLGMEYLVFAPTMLTDKNNHISTLYKFDFIKDNDVNHQELLDICLRNAEKSDFKVFIGLNFNEKWWDAPYTKEWLEDEMKIGNSIMKELIDRYKLLYPTAFHGWYWVWEVDNYLSQTLSSKDALISALNINVDFINKHTPDMPLLLSPFMNARLGSPSVYRETWEYVFSKVRFKKGDIFCPQDCVGAGGLKENEVSSWFKELGKAVSRNKKLVFWGNVETFNQAEWTSRTIDRLVNQMNTVNEYVDTIISFAYSHYYSPKAINSNFHKAYKYYLEHSELPKLTKPDLINNLVLTKKKDDYELSWDAVPTSSEVVGCRIYNKEGLLREVQLPKTNTSLIIDGEGITDEYYIVTYNAVGLESEKLSLIDKL